MSLSPDMETAGRPKQHAHRGLTPPFFIPPVSLAEPAVGAQVEQALVLVKKDLKPTDGSRHFILAKFRDETGEINCALFNQDVEILKDAEVGHAYLVKGAITNHVKYGPQLTVYSAEDLGTDHPVLAAINPVCPVPRAILLARYNRLVDQIRNPGLKKFLDYFLAEQAPLRDFGTAPAALGNHHAYKHGLIQHSIEVVEIALAIVSAFEYPANRCLVIVAGLLHDIGKLVEYGFKNQPFGMASRGRLINHLVVGPIMTEKVWEAHKEELIAFGMCEEEFWLIQHIQVAHHGTYEWGSPVMPACLEAHAIHMADLASASYRKMGEAEQSAEPDKEGWIAPANREFWRGLFKVPHRDVLLPDIRAALPNLGAPNRPVPEEGGDFEEGTV